jgi:hypothetical protein
MMKILIAAVVLAGVALAALAGGGVMLQCTNCSQFATGGNARVGPSTNDTSHVFLVGGGETLGVVYTLHHCATCGVFRSSNHVSLEDAKQEIARFTALAAGATNAVQKKRLEYFAKGFQGSLERGRNPARNDLCPQCSHKWTQITLDPRALGREPQTNQVLNLPCSHCAKMGVRVRDAHLHWD